MANHELSKREVLDKAQAYCARAEHCAADVRRKLYEWGVKQVRDDFSSEKGVDFFDFIVQKLYEDDFLNDVRFCRAYVHDKVEYQSWGRRKIEAGLQALQLPSSAIAEALQSIDEERYAANLHALSRQRQSDSEEKRLRFLLQRGFTYDEITSI